ncbi:SulP family inorganic anion transporter [Novosphingobium sp. 1949]|uniref:SulP family inorganic anion transporter n=1 Tax=Novosphingobium organovorum TaxID=2930092 RepID=A0ABT0BDS7_9SPHN|nr:SulP family inorganic anion transporter [Novosphingobium organovorum]MCJ2183200.1 SulP family inorganic anion transporter [Novosphingobium organovorum]
MSAAPSSSAPDAAPAGSGDGAGGLFAHFGRDFTASIVVFLVAMPLCMGIAIASGVPPEKGLVTGIIGGIVVGLFAGSPLQVSGPAAGLAVIVFEFVREHGLETLGPVLLLAGVLQLVAGWARLGGLFRAISPAVVHGMLAGIGALIVIGQFHILFDAKPASSGTANLAAIPGRVFGIDLANASSTEIALGLGLLTIVVMLGWEKLRPKALALVPGALLGVLAATLVAWTMGLSVARIEVPASIGSAFALPTSAAWFAPLASPALMITALAIAFIASAETLLSAAAVDRMHDGVRTKYDKELSAQGIGNMLCGLVGALPMTGVIVRSSANVQAGARTRLSTMLHGIWILGFIALLPWLLREVPMASLGGVLVITGWRLVSLKHVTHLYRNHGYLPAAIWAVTFVLVVTTDLLTGVLVGLALSVIELLPHVRDIRLKVHEHEEEEGPRVALHGAATFVGLTRLNSVLERQPHDKPVHLDLGSVRGMDHTTAETLSEWISRRRQRGHADRITGSEAILRPLGG